MTDELLLEVEPLPDLEPEPQFQVVHVGNGETIFFAESRAAFLRSAPARTPTEIVETIQGWDGAEGQPFWVSWVPDRATRPVLDSRSRLRPPAGPPPSADQYGFDMPRTFTAPTWWRLVHDRWRAR